MNIGSVESFNNSGYPKLPVLRRWRIKFFNRINEENPLEGVDLKPEKDEGFIHTTNTELQNEVHRLNDYVRDSPKFQLYYSKLPKSTSESVTLYFVKKVFEPNYCIVSKIMLTKRLGNIHYEVEFRFARIAFSLITTALIALFKVFTIICIIILTENILLKKYDFVSPFFYAIIFLIIDFFITFKCNLSRMLAINIYLTKYINILLGMFWIGLIFSQSSRTNSSSLFHFNLIFSFAPVLLCFHLLFPVNYLGRDRVSKIELNVMKHYIKGYLQSNFL